MIDYATLKNWPFAPVHQSYAAKDVILYNIGVGCGCGPLDDDDLAYVYEKDLRVLPTFANVLGYPGFWARNPATGIDVAKLLHGEQTLRLHRPLKPAGTVVGTSRVLRVVDKGLGKGALLLIERRITDKETGDLLATIEQLNILRGDGGFSARGQPSDAAPDGLPSLPDRPPDQGCDLPTRPETALIYRLCGDDNPLHADPAVARAAGFERPILHGLATFGIAGRAILKTFRANRPEGLTMLRARFTAPVYPGDTIRTEMWRDVAATVRFRSSALERGVIVLNQGTASLA